MLSTQGEYKRERKRKRERDEDREGERARERERESCGGFVVTECKMHRGTQIPRGTGAEPKAGVGSLRRSTGTALYPPPLHAL